MSALRDPVVYQIYPRSWQDSDGDGEGDLRGALGRLDHVARLGADAVWLSPFYPSPMADGGYDVADYCDVDRRFGTLADADALIARAHELGLAVLLDVVPCHTSIEHPWFREHPERYVWADGDAPPNNWRATFGGSAWSRDPASGRWYLHSFYPEQPDLDWRNPDVPRAMGDVLRFWCARGVDGFRLDALDRLMKDARLRDDPPASGPPPLPLHDEHATLDHVHSRDAPDVGEGLAALRAAAGDDAFLVGEVYLPTAELGPYLEHLDVAFAFELYHAGWGPGELRAALETVLALQDRLAWVTSNHDFPRLASRVGPVAARAAAMLLLCLPGAVFVYQGDELGAEDGPGHDPPRDRAARDAFRHPVAWDDTRQGGFTTGEPWLQVLTPAGGSAVAQWDDPRSSLRLYRDLVELRRSLTGRAELVDAGEGIVAVRRGDVLVAVNLGPEPAPAPRARRLLRHTHEPAATGPPARLAPGEGVVLAGLPSDG